MDRHQVDGAWADRRNGKSLSLWCIRKTNKLFTKTLVKLRVNIQIENWGLCRLQVQISTIRRRTFATNDRAELAVNTMYPMSESNFDNRGWINDGVSWWQTTGNMMPSAISQLLGPFLFLTAGSLLSKSPKFAHSQFHQDVVERKVWSMSGVAAHCASNPESAAPFSRSLPRKQSCTHHTWNKCWEVYKAFNYEQDHRIPA